MFSNSMDMSMCMYLDNDVRDLHFHKKMVFLATITVNIAEVAITIVFIASRLIITLAAIVDACVDFMCILVVHALVAMGMCWSSHGKEWR